MKAMMLIAGRGTRLAPLTDYVPKCCLPIAGVPLLHIWIRKLEAAGVTEVILNPSHGAKFVMGCFRAAIPRFSSMTFRSEKEPLGTAQTILRNADWVRGEDFLVVYGDVLTNIDLSVLEAAHKKKQSLVTMQAYLTGTPSAKGILTVDEKGWATDFVEKPVEPVSNLAFSGIFCAKPEFLDEIAEKDVDLGSDVLKKLTRKKKKCFVCHDAEVYFKDIGTIPDYLRCQVDWRQLNG